MNEATWIAAVSLFITGLFTWLTKRDSLRHDGELRDLKNQNTTQAAQIATLTADGVKCEERAKASEAKASDCEKKHKTMEVKITEIEAAIAKLNGHDPKK